MRLGEETHKGEGSLKWEGPHKGEGHSNRRGHSQGRSHSTGWGLEVCTGSKLKPEPGPYPRLSDPTRPDPSGTVKFRARTRPEIPPPQRIANKKKRKKAAFHDCMQRNRLIKALPFHKHLPVMKVCEHQVQRSHTFCRVYEFCMDKKIILPPYKLWSFFVS